MEEQNKERAAAIVIQNYYRRYKQYAYYRQMTNAALVIQHGYRSYCLNKCFKKKPQQEEVKRTMESTGKAANTAEMTTSSGPGFGSLGGLNAGGRGGRLEVVNSGVFGATSKETSPSGPLK